MKNKFLKGLVASFALAASGIANAGLISLDGMGLITEWIDYENQSNEMPGYIWGNSDTLKADGVGIYVEFANGLNGSLTYSGVSELWNSTFSGLAYDSASGIFTQASGLHFLFNVDTNGTLPMAWVNNSIVFSGNFDLDYNEYNGSHFRANTTGWESATVQVFSSAYPVQDVPEPSTLAIFAIGIMGLAFRKFNKQA